MSSPRTLLEIPMARTTVRLTFDATPGVGAGEANADLKLTRFAVFDGHRDALSPEENSSQREAEASSRRIVQQGTARCAKLSQLIDIEAVSVFDDDELDAVSHVASTNHDAVRPTTRFENSSKKSVAGVARQLRIGQHVGQIIRDLDGHGHRGHPDFLDDFMEQRGKREPAAEGRGGIIGQTKKSKGSIEASQLSPRVSDRRLRRVVARNVLRDELQPTLRGTGEGRERSTDGPEDGSQSGRKFVGILPFTVRLVRESRRACGARVAVFAFVEAPGSGGSEELELGFWCNGPQSLLNRAQRRSEFRQEVGLTDVICRERALSSRGSDHQETLAP